MVHVMHHMHSPVLCKHLVATILQALCIIHSQMEIVKCLFNKAKEEGKDLYKCLMIYCNNPLQVACRSRSARSDLPMSNAARKQLGIQPEVIRNIDKHEV